MKFYIKQKVFSIKDKFSIKDEQGNDCYQVSGKMMSLHNKLDILNMSDEVVLKIHKKVFSFLPKYYLDDPHDRRMATIHKKFSFMRPKFEVDLEQGQMVVSGSPWAMNFEITLNDTLAATISKKMVSWGDSYEIDILIETHQLLLLGIVIIIDQIIHENKKNN